MPASAINMERDTSQTKFRSKKSNSYKFTSNRESQSQTESNFKQSQTLR